MDNQCHSFVQSLSHHSFSLMDQKIYGFKIKISVLERSITFFCCSLFCMKPSVKKTTIRATVRLLKFQLDEKWKTFFFPLINKIQNSSNIIFNSTAYFGKFPLFIIQSHQEKDLKDTPHLFLVSSSNNHPEQVWFIF